MNGTIKKSNVQDIIELNGIQKGMLFHYLKETDENLYNVQLTLEVNGRFSHSILKSAINNVQSRNEALRSVFSWEHISNPVQIILKEYPIELEYQDISHLDAELADEVEQKHIASNRDKRFNLSQLPLRLTLIKKGEDKHILAITHHHILYDGWSTGIFLKELFLAYDHLTEKNENGYSIKPLYSDVIKKTRQKQKTSGEAAFWKNYLQGHTRMNGLPAGNGENYVRRLRYTIPSKAVEAFSAKHKITKAAVMYAAYGLLVHKYHQADDIVFGTTVSNRDAAIHGSGDVMGNFLNTVPFRVRISRELPLLELVKNANMDIRSASDFSNFSYFDIKQLLNLKPDQELFNAVIAIENYPIDKHAINGYRDFSISVKNIYEHVSIPLAVNVFFKDDIEVEFMYNTSKVADDYARDFSARFVTAVNEIVTNSERSVASASLYPDSEREAWQPENLSAVEPYFADYWYWQLTKIKPLELPTDHPRKPVLTYSAASVDIDLPAGLLDKAVRYQEKSGLDLNIILMAAFKVLLRTYCRHNEIVIGVPGPIANLLPLKSEVSPDLSFTEFASVLNETYQNGVKYGWLPVERLAKILHIQSDASRNTLFDVVFQYNDTGNEYTKYDLALSLQNAHGSINGKLVFNSQYFNHDTIVSLVDHYYNLLQNLLSFPEAKLSGIEVVSASEKDQLLHLLDNSQVNYPRDKTIIDLFKEQVRRSPDSIAVKFGNETLSYSRLDHLSDVLATALVRQGVTTDVVVGLLCDRTIEMLIAMFGILKAGGAYLPIDVDYPVERIQYLITDSKAPVLLTNRQYADKVTCDIPVLFIEEVIKGDAPASEVVCTATPSSLCYVIYTSGTTGNPKGVMIEHRNVVRLLFNDAFQYDFSSSDVWTMFHSHCFDFSVWEIYGALLYGGRVVIIPKSIAKDTAAYLDVLRTEGVTVLNQTPSAFYGLLQHELSSDGALDLRYVIFGGDALSPRKLKEWYRKYPDVKLINMYGITETTVHVTYKEIGPYEIENGVSNIGTPIPTLSLYLLDEYGKVIPRGVIGELYVGGEGVARGYLQKPELTAKVFLNDPYHITERVYKTGDLARILHTGELEYIGRIDHQVQLRGFRIELGEIESQLEKHDEVKDVVVLAKGSDEDKFLVAYYVSTTQTDIADARSFLMGRLPEYMIPSFFIRLEQMPLTSNGKLDRKALPDPETVSGDEYLAPANETESLLAEVWSEVLKIDKETISVTKSFFEMGGHSLNATTLANRMSRRFEVSIPLQDVFTYPDIRSLAKLINARKPAAFASIPQTAEKPYYKVTSSQKQLFFLHQLNPSSLAYNMPYIERIVGELQLEKLTTTFQKLINRHEIFRTTFEVINGEVVQKIMNAADLTIEYYEADRNEDEIIKKFIRPFDLAKAPLLRAGIVKVGQHEHLLMLDMHHIINDGVSQGIIVKDFLAIYKDEVLPPLSLQYKDYAEWQQSNERQLAISEQGAFWRNLFADNIPVLELPADHARPAFKSDEGAVIDFELTGTQVRHLKAMAEQEGCTFFMILLAAYNVLLGKLANQDDIVMGVPVAGRQHSDVEQMTGLFFNILPMRNRPQSAQSFREFLGSVKENVLNFFANQAYPYEQLIDDLKIERDVSRNPLFDVLFLYDNFETDVLSIPGMEVEPYPYQHPVSKADLTLSAITKGNAVSLRFEYATSLFRESTIKRFVTYFNGVISEIIADVNKKIAVIDILPEVERNKLLFEFNETQGEYDRQSTIVSLFKAQAAKTPDNICVVFADRSLTYREVDEQSNQLARQLNEEFNVRKGDFVSVLMRRSEKLLVSLLAVLKTGAAYLPVDPSYPTDRIKHILRDSGASVLLSDELTVGAGYEGEVLYFDNPRKTSYSSDDVELPVAPENTCYLIYTSGSTGVPKGVMISHKNVVNFFAGMNARLTVDENDCLLSVTSIAFDISVLELFWTICHGIEVVIYPSDTNLSDLDRYVQDEVRELDFSLFFFSSYNNEQETGKYDLLLQSVEYADKEGFKAVWTPERHFHEFGGLYPNPSVLSAALAMTTKNIELRSGSVVSPLHDVLRIAEEWSVVDNLSGGRIALSFASGWNPDDFALSPDAYKTRHAKMYAQIEELKRLWKGETVTRVNGLGKEKALRIFPRPVQKELPIWVTSAGSPDTFRSAGEKGANVLTHFLGQDIKMLSDNIQLYREARINAGHDRGKVTLMLHTYLGDNIAEVEAVVREPFIEYLKSSIGLSKIIFEQAGFKEEDVTEELKDKILNNSFRRYYKEGALIGTKDSCSEMISKLKRIGVDEVACLVDFGVEQNKVLEGLVRLKELKNLHAHQEIKLNKRVTMMQSTPSFINLLLGDQGSVNFLSSLRTLLVGGEALSLSLLQHITKGNDRLKVYNMYGPTETTIWSCTSQPDETTDRITIGKPILNTQIYILDNNLQLVPFGVAGCLYIGGEGVSSGYWNRDELTAARFIQNPFNPQEKIYDTGDVARWLPNGEIEYVGRKDHQVKIRGFRIELGEIEKCLRDIEGIEDAVVIVKEKAGHGKYLVAYIIAEHLTDLVIRTHLAKQLPYYMMPAHIVSLDKFPLTPNGKLDRNAFPEPKFEAGNEHVAPQTPEEEVLVDIWSKVLGVEGIGVTDSFFSAGGDSIKSIQIISRLRTLGYELTVKDIFTTQHIRELALRLKTASVADQSPVSGPFTLTPIQRWFFDGPVINKHHYNQAVMLTFNEQVTPETIGTIFTEIQTHHDALRMVFSVTEAGVVAETKEPSMPVLVEIHDLQNNNDPDESIAQICDKIQGSIDLSTGPLMKLGLFQLNNESRLLIAIHHLVIDGISWRILFEEIETLYQQIKARQPLSLPLKTDAFQSWSGRLLQYAGSNEFNVGAEYWKQLLDRPAARIPRDHPHGSSAMSTQKEVAFHLDKESTFKLLTKVHHAFGTQINDILLAALLLSIRKVYGNVTATIDMEGHGREEIVPNVNYSRTVGWFTTIFPVLLEAETSDIAGVIKYVKETLHKIPNKGIDYLLQQYHEEEAGFRETGKALHSQIFFNYLGQFDTDIAQKSFSVDYKSAGNVISENENLDHDWDILAILSGGELAVRLIYGDGQYNSATIERLMGYYRDALVEIINFCSASDKVSLTPSDLTYKELSIAQVEELQEEHEVEDVCTLAPMQESIRFHALKDADSPYYFVQISYNLTGDLDIKAVENSYTQLIDRYSVLRTVFLDKYEQPVQVVLKKRETDFNFKDLRNECLTGSTENIIESHKLKDRLKKFDLQRDCLFRLTVLQTGDTSFTFIWSYHHIIMDGWCVGIIMQDFKEMYAGYRRGETASLPVVTPYARYIEWLQGRNREQAMSFWKNYLASYESPVTLPQIKLKASEKINDERLSKSVILNETRVQLLQGLSVKFGVTLNTILQVAWSILLSKYNDTNDVIFGTVVSGRPLEVPGIESMIGLFMNTIPVRIQYADNDTVGDLLQKVQNKAIEAEPYHYNNLSEIESLTPFGASLLDHVLILENFPLSDEVQGSYVVDKERGEEYTVSNVEMFDHNDNNFYVIIAPGKEINVRFDYSPSRYEGDTVEKIADRFVNVLDQIAANSNLLVSEVQLATQQEKQQVLQEFNNTAFEYPQNETLVTLFEMQADRSASNVAVVYNNQSITYRDLNTRANAIANKIKNKLPETGNQKIGLLFEPSIDLVACMLGALKAGCAYVALSPETPDERNKYILSDCDAQLLLMQSDIYFRKRAGATLISPSRALLIDQDEQMKEEANPVNGLSPKDLVYVIYTSGTTGIPKGVEIEHRGIVNMLSFHQHLYNVERGAHVSQVANVIFDASAFEIWPCLVQGACLHIAPKDVRLDPQSMQRWLIVNNIEVSFQTPAVAQYLLKSDWSAENCRLRIMNIAGDRLNYVPERQFPFRIFNLYGPTEDSIWTTWTELPYEGIDERYSIGKPIGNKQIYIIDKSNHLLPAGIPGEICISGDGLARGYINDPKLTAEKFIGNPFIPGERLYKTGDFGSWLPDGSIEFFGRSDSQVKIRGFRIELGEIDWQLSSFPGIIEAATVVRSNQDTQFLVAYYVAEDEIPSRELRDYLQNSLPDYMVPVHFMHLTAMPLTPGGKLDRKALPEPEFKVEEDFLAASNEVEKSILKIWSEVLQLEEDMISVDKNFFQLGGHSLKIVAMVSKINKQLDVSISLNDAFEKGSIRDLADYVITIGQHKFETTSNTYPTEIVL